MDERKEHAMGVRVRALLAAVVVMAAMAAFGAGPALADPPTVERESIAGDRLICDDTVITLTGGTVVVRSHLHETPHGLFRVTGSVVVEQATAVDQHGNTYQVVGSANFNFTTPDPEQEGGEVGHFIANLNVIGEDGLVGSVKLFLRDVGRSPEIELSRGTCDFLEE
jgi:hypothetical protein